MPRGSGMMAQEYFIGGHHLIGQPCDGHYAYRIRSGTGTKVL